MCGIAGLFQFKAPVERDELGRFTDALAHRGPDGRGLLLDASVGLGHRQLNFLRHGRSGRGPIPFEDSQAVAGADRWRGRIAALGRSGCEQASLTPYRYWITFDGEIYNSPELSRELRAMGYVFRTPTDAELVLAAHAQWGAACLARFNGVWAFAIWDRQERRLFLARDRFGSKPLHYYHTPACFAFASELKAFLALKDFRPALNADLVPALLAGAETDEGAIVDTLMTGVKRVPAGHTLLIAADGTAHMRRWWETRDQLPAVPPRYEDQVARFRELLVDAVRIRQAGTIPIGTCLTGSMDSSTIACTLAHVARGDDAAGKAKAVRRTRTLLAEFPETTPGMKAVMDEVARDFGGSTSRWRLTGVDAARRAVASVWSCEEAGGAPAGSLFGLYGELRSKGIGLTLEGHGGDALLGGALYQLDWPMAQTNDHLYRDFHASRWPARLRNLDRCAMAHGVQVRMPFMDWRLVTLAHALPAGSKFGGGMTERVLRDAMDGLMPDTVRLRCRATDPGAGLDGWRNPALKGLIAAIVEHPSWLASPHWNGAEWREAALHLATGSGAPTPDPILAGRIEISLGLALWERLFVERSDPENLLR